MTSSEIARPAKRALVIVDVQNDFADPNGSLYVPGGEVIAQGLARALKCRQVPADVDVIVATRDWHGEQPGTHFEKWPVHCVASSWGAELYPSIEQAAGIDELFYKGEDRAAYSGFEGVSAHREQLDGYLKARGVTDVTVVGLATDFCVKATALDAANLGYVTTLYLEFCAGVGPETTATAISDMKAVGVQVVGPD